MLSPAIRIAIACALLVVGGLSVWFGRRQNRRASPGGAISRPKQLWLGFAIFVWFFLSPILALEPRLHGSLRTVLALFAGMMWIRGVAELVMMYGTKTWRPPYGIAHDLSCALAIVAWAVVEASVLGGLTTPLDRLTLGFVAVLLVSVLFETYYAIAFHGAVEGKTTGDAGLWFASADDPRFRRINGVTKIGNAILFAALLAYLLAAFA